MAVTAISTKEEFNRALEDNWRKLVVINFFSADDTKCCSISNGYQILASRHSDVVFLDVEISRCTEVTCALRNGCQITELPTFLFFKEEFVVDKYCGTEEPDLENKILKNK